MLDIAMKNKTPFSGKVRVRVCGILTRNEKILLLKHHSVGPRGYLWCPPGGGVAFGQSLHKTLQREFLEETNLSIEVGEYLFANEHIDEQHHAIELFFTANYRSGRLRLGIDPELSLSNQILLLEGPVLFRGIQLTENSSLFYLPHVEIYIYTYIEISTSDWKKIFKIRGLITFENS